MIRSDDTADRLHMRPTERVRRPLATLGSALAAALAAGAAPTCVLAQTNPTADMVLLEADSVVSDEAAGTVTAEGDVQIRYKERTLRADRIVYDTASGQVNAFGNVQLVESDGSATFAEQVQVDQALSIGVARELRTRMEPQGMLAAEAAIRSSETRNELRRVVYTSCPVCEETDSTPTWSIRARRAVQDQDNRVIAYRDAVFQVAGAPVLYLPYFAHPDPGAERASGLLTPDFGSSGSIGVFYEQPYYWAISPYQDLTPSLRLHGNVNPLMGAEYRKSFYSGDIIFTGTLTSEQNFDGDGAKFGDESWRSSLFASGQFALTDFWRWGFGAERISDDLYLRRYELEGYGQVRGPYIGDNTRLISQLYAIGQNKNSFASVSTVSFQGLRTNDSEDLLPIILPYADYERVLKAPWLDGQVRLRGNAAVLQRSTGADTARATLAANWRRDVVFGPGLMLSPFAEARADVFRNETATDTYETFTRNLGMAGAELSWPFMRVGKTTSTVIEPVVMAAYGSPGGDDPRIVNEDSIGFEVDDSSVLSPNAVSNYDLWEPGGRIAAGVRATATDTAGRSARVFFGRRWRDEAADQFTAQNNLDGTSSDWVGAAEANLGDSFSTSFRFRVDEDLELEALDADVRGTLGRVTAGARYYQVGETLSPDNPSEEVYADLGVRLAAGWRMQYGVRRDLDSNTNIRQDIRALYQDDCTFLEITYSRTETSVGTLGPDEGFRVRIGLTSLGLQKGK